MPRDNDTDATSTEATNTAEDTRADSNRATGDSRTHAESNSASADFSLEDTKQAQGVQKVNVRGMGTAFAQLATFGTFEKYEQRGRGGAADITAKTVAEILNDHYHDPDFASANGGSGLTGEDVADMKPSVPGALLDAIIDEATQVQMNPDGSATVSTSGNSAGR